MCVGKNKQAAGFGQLRSLYLQDRVNEIASRNPKTSRLFNIRTAVEKRIHEEALLPSNQQRLANEVAYERKKAETKIKKAETKLKGAKTTKKSQANKKQEAPTEEDVTDIVTLLLVFRKTAKNVMEAADEGKLKKKRSKPLHSITLWADGPAINPVSQFSETIVLAEYRHAVHRKDLPLSECTCSYCEPGDPVLSSEAAHKVHATWHAKFRKFFALRSAAYPNYQDFTTLLTDSQQKLLMRSLVSLWKQVDPDLPYFHSEAYAQFDSLAADDMEAINTAKNTKAAVEDAIAATASTPAPLGIRVPREYQTKYNRTL